MRMLLDTHVFIWWDSDPSRLSPVFLAALEDRTNEMILSVVSLWEIQIKVQLGKLVVRRPIQEIVESQKDRNGMQVIRVEAEHVYGLADLPPYHKDPFDRLLIAQANVEGLILVSADPILRSYPVTLLKDE